jgi:transcriptional regulator
MNPDRFTPKDPQDVARLVRAYPLGWIISGVGADARATALPLRPVLGRKGEVERLLGHFARSNPQVADLTAEPEALVLLLGPHGYISPSWMADRTQAPTWNYASVQFRVRLRLIEDPAPLQALIRDLTQAMEAGRPNPWSVEEMGERYARLARGVIGFEADVLETRAKFKLGQDERADVFADILTALAAQSDGQALADWMKAYDPRKD